MGFPPKWYITGVFRWPKPLCFHGFKGGGFGTYIAGCHHKMVAKRYGFWPLRSPFCRGNSKGDKNGDYSSQC